MTMAAVGQGCYRTGARRPGRMVWILRPETCPRSDVEGLDRDVLRPSTLGREYAPVNPPATVCWQAGVPGAGLRGCRRKIAWARVRMRAWRACARSRVAIQDQRLTSDPTLFGCDIAELAVSENAPACTYVWGLDLSGTEQGAGGVGGLLWLTSFQLPASSFQLPASSFQLPASSSSYFAAYDGNGNVAALVHAPSSMPHARYEYGPFGEPIRVTGPAAGQNPFRFSTKRIDPTTDLILYEHRAYSPTLGRWLSRDPVEQIGASAHLFVKNAPAQFVDPYGTREYPNPCPRGWTKYVDGREETPTQTVFVHPWFGPS